MKENSRDRAVILGEYIVDTGATVRATAAVFKISKSTVHTAVTLSNGLYGWWRRNHAASNKKTAVGRVSPYRRCVYGQLF